jgi:hypothetical protein
VTEFLATALLLAGNQDVVLGAPATPDARAGGLVHFQLFRQGDTSGERFTSDSPFFSSAEMHADGCIYVAATPATSPFWYDTYAAEDGAFRNLPVPLPDRRSLADIEGPNRSPADWPPVWLRYDWDREPGAHGGPFPFFSGPAPRWYQLCVPPGSRPADWTQDQVRQIPPPTSPSVDQSGRYCDWDTSGVGTFFGNGVPEWVALEPTAQGWLSRAVDGIVTNSFLSGEDAHVDHSGPPDNYDLGSPHPFIPLGNSGCDPARDFFQDPEGYFSAIQQLCNDWEMNVQVDPEHRSVLAPSYAPPSDVECDELRGGAALCGKGNPSSDLGGNLGLEIEQWLIPVDYRPQPGDRIHAVGRWIVDCGHDDWHTELHPVELVESSHAITPVAGVDQARTHGNPASQTNVVITGAWQGGSLEFDVWPLARPAATARLRFARRPPPWDGAMEFVEGLQIQSEVALPADNPNHVRVRVTAPQRTRTSDRFGQVSYDAHLRLATSYLLWWETPAPLETRPPSDGRAR